MILGGWGGGEGGRGGGGRVNRNRYYTQCSVDLCQQNYFVSFVKSEKETLLEKTLRSTYDEVLTLLHYSLAATSSYP